MTTIIQLLLQSLQWVVIAVMLLGAGMALALMAGFSPTPSSSTESEPPRSPLAPLMPRAPDGGVDTAVLEEDVAQFMVSLRSAMGDETIPAVRAIRAVPRQRAIQRRDEGTAGWLPMPADSRPDSRFISARQYLSMPSADLWDAWWAKPVTVQRKALSGGALRSHSLRLLICEPPRGPMLN